MKCLSVAQPWAWAIMHAGKTVENRSWTTAHRGDLLIQASKSRDWLQGGLTELGAMGFAPKNEDLVQGVIVGVVELIQVEASFAAQRLLAESHHKWITNQGWCWVVKNPRRFVRPVPFPGQMSLFDVPESVIKDELVRLGMRGAVEQTDGLDFGAGSGSGQEVKRSSGLVGGDEGARQKPVIGEGKVVVAQGRLW